MSSPHDALFRQVFADAAQAAPLLAAVLPEELAAAIDWATLAPAPAGAVDAGLATTERDLCFAAVLRDTTAAVRLVLEHKSYADPLTTLQLLRYLLADWEAMAAAHGAAAGLPPIVPIVVHHGPRPWGAASSFADLFDAAGWLAVRLDAPPVAAALEPHTVGLRLVVDDLAAVGEAALAQRPLPALGRLALLCLQCLRGAPPTQAEAALRRWGPLWRELWASPQAPFGLPALATYILEVTELAGEVLRDLLAAAVESRMGDEVMSTAEKLRAEGRLLGRAEGRQEGFHEGRQEGRQEGKLSLLAHQLQRRFGPLPPTALAALAARSDAELDAIGERLLDARSLAEALGTG